MLLRLDLLLLEFEDGYCARLLCDAEALLLDWRVDRELTSVRDFPEVWRVFFLCVDFLLPPPCFGIATAPEALATDGEFERTGCVRDLPCLAPER